MHRTPVKSAARASLSPPAWKDQLKQRCMARLRQDRQRLLAKLRSPDASTSIAAEMRQLIRSEGQRNAGPENDADEGKRRHAVFGLLEDADDDWSIDELLEKGKLSQDEYMELVHSLEEALLAEMEMENGPGDEEYAEHMMEFEEEALEAMLAGMELDDQEMPACDEFELDDEAIAACSDAYMLCPICKVHSLHDSSTTTSPSISCPCGFTFAVKNVFNGVIEDFREKLVTAFMDHRDYRHCYSDPCFEKATAFDHFMNPRDAMRIRCHDCGCDRILP